MAGTPGYIAPERLVAENAHEPRADLFSLGATLYFALTAQPPFPGASAAEVLERQLNSVIRCVPRSGVPRGLEQLVLDLLQPRPANRPSSAEVVGSRLARCRAEAPAAAAGPTGVTATLVTVPRDRGTRSGTRRRRWPLALTGLALAAAALALRRVPAPLPLPSPPPSARGADLAGSAARVQSAVTAIDRQAEDIFAHLRAFDQDTGAYVRLLTGIATPVRGMTRELESAFTLTEGRELLPLAPAPLFAVWKIHLMLERLHLVPAGDSTLAASPLPDALRRLRQVIGARFTRGFGRVTRLGAASILDQDLAPPGSARDEEAAAALGSAAGCADELLARMPVPATPTERLILLRLWSIAFDAASLAGDRVRLAAAADRSAANLEAFWNEAGWPPGRASASWTAAATAGAFGAADDALMRLVERAADTTAPRTGRESALRLALRCIAGPMVSFWSGNADFQKNSRTRLQRAAAELGYRVRPGSL